MPTMADVARSAGVSVATVSHVLNGTRPVLPHTRQAVLDAVDELGYTPNTLARSLVTSRTRSIGLAVSAISNPYFTEILQGVEAAALQEGYSLLIADPHDDPEHEHKVVRLLHERRVDGMIVAPSADPRRLLAYLDRHAVPTVFLDRVVDAPGEDVDGATRFDQVCAENTGPMARLVAHLAGLGHRRIGLVAGLPGLSTTGDRITGYR
ncbi:LacI family DNA-binding transcriptional regulator, partial [Streptomyces sp. NPDC058964]|uniref:LacI family DNA-binding transcriptional regulator n=1 Tax=Streptomyces sp. NPDC058964 TaxID=3346681 RepID=UPI0036B030E2